MNITVGFSSKTARLMSSSFLLMPLAQFQWQTVKGVFACLQDIFDDILTTCFFLLPTRAEEFWIVPEGLDSTQGCAVADSGRWCGGYLGSFLLACRSDIEFVSAIKKNGFLSLELEDSSLPLGDVVYSQAFDTNRRGRRLGRSSDEGSGSSSPGIPLWICPPEGIYDTVLDVSVCSFFL